MCVVVCSSFPSFPFLYSSLVSPVGLRSISAERREIDPVHVVCCDALELDCCLFVDRLYFSWLTKQVSRLLVDKPLGFGRNPGLTICTWWQRCCGPAL